MCNLKVFSAFCTVGIFLILGHQCISLIVEQFLFFGVLMSRPMFAIFSLLWYVHDANQWFFH